MTGWDSRIQREMEPCTQAQCTSVMPVESAEWEGEKEKKSEERKEPVLEEGGGGEWHCTGRDPRGTCFVVYGRAAKAAHARASRSTSWRSLSSPLQRGGAMWCISLLPGEKIFYCLWL
jgi:hypothetical protein